MLLTAIVHGNPHHVSTLRVHFLIEFGVPTSFMKFSISSKLASDDHSRFKLARMARKGNEAAEKQTVDRIDSWNIMHILSFAFLGALTAAYLWARTSTVTGNCPATPPKPQVKILSLDPFIAHITDFISESERKYLLDLGYVHPVLSQFHPRRSCFNS